MKGVNFSCASPASAAVCTSMDRRSTLRPTTTGGSSSSGAIHRRPPLLPPPLQDHRPRPKPAAALLNSAGVNFSCASPASAAVCTSIDRRSTLRPTTTGGSSSGAIHRRPPLLPPPLQDHRPRPKPAAALLNSAASHETAPPARTKSHIEKISSRRSSSRYLLLNSDADFMGGAPHLFPKLEVVGNGGCYQAAAAAAFKAAAPSTTAIATTTPSEQVVHLRVSLHCKGCEGKVRKHISKMEGVTSFEINLKTKKVTVVGEVTPFEVLSSISKVKNAQFWT